ncbi:ADP-ribosylglycohydrolase-domain-containing protein [Podospora aff. communis PSN243]|uniref:ADP-ribosylglycohydrolase-domain-containing protein n=1 Tax=Podospora aff. communis PSN243 TaxID=3040156 RepID=A0AAV9G601_9PEZI|nr:ADP-ribosylglycohydrolase-domain-containing protein [Podospora aff. communis PSN243]
MDSLPAACTSALLRAALADRVVGVVLGSALGDTIGLYTEFLSAATAAESYLSRTFTLTPHPTPPKFDLHRASKPPAHWTDDTDHALLLLLAFLHTASTESDTPPALPTQTALAQRLRVWVQQGLRPLETMPLGLGRLVGSVVATKGFEERPEEIAREHWEKTGKKAAPNGSLMRTHPLGLMCLWREEREAFVLAADISRVTHVDPRCVVACVIGTALVRALVRGEVDGEEALDGVLQRGREWAVAQGEELDAEELDRHLRCNSLEELKLDESTSVGYVYKCLGSGVLLLRLAMRKMAESGGDLLTRSRLFEQLVTDLVMCGGDADTNACFAGALLGAYLGYGALPDHWSHGLAQEEWLLSKAEALCRILGLKEGRYVGQEDKDTHLDGGKPNISQAEMEGRWMVLQADVAKQMEEQAKANATKLKGKGSSWTASLPWKDKTKR